MIEGGPNLLPPLTISRREVVAPARYIQIPAPARQKGLHSLQEMASNHATCSLISKRVYASPEERYSPLSNNLPAFFRGCQLRQGEREREREREREKQRQRETERETDRETEPDARKEQDQVM